MSLINRIAVANLSNTKGASDSEWSPRYRYEILNFGGHSAVVNLANGGGKTTLANALIGLLSRHQGLLNRTKEHAAPSRGVYSHIQVELVAPTGHTSQRDFLTESGEEVSGEKWVFGMAMHSEGDNQFYYYPGVLEECPPASRDADGTLRVISNTQFETAAKAIKGMEWGVGKEAWRTQMSLHIPFETLLGIAEFQVKGGADKDAPLFKLVEQKDEDGKRIHENLDERFFYEILAPELLSDVFEQGEGDEEKTADQYLFDEARNLVKTRHVLEAKRVEVDAMGVAMERLRTASEAGRDAVSAKSRCDQAIKGRRLDLAVLHDLVFCRPIPGVPRATLPEGKVGEVSAHLVVVPGESAPRITDAGLGVILGKSVNVVNQAGLRLNIKGRKFTQLIGIPCDFKLEMGNSHGGSRHDKTTYTYQQAVSIIRKQDGDGAVALLDDALTWFDGEADTNPFRPALTEIEADQKQAETSVHDLQNLIEEKQGEALRLSSAQKEVEDNEHAYQYLIRCGQFTEEELGQPKDTWERVEREYRGARGALQAHRDTLAGMKVYLPDWEQYRTEYGEEDPSSLHESLTEKKRQAVTARNSNESEIRTTEHAKGETVRQLNGVDREYSTRKQERERIVLLAETAAPVLATLMEEESAVGLEQGIRKALAQAQKAQIATQQEAATARAGVERIRAFDQRFPGQSPSGWIAAAKQSRRTLISEQDALGLALKNLQRERLALNTNPVAAGDIANRVLAALVDVDVSHQDLHSFVAGLKLADPRFKDVLGMFSSLLFAPVVESPSEALRAAEALEQLDLPAPVFHADALRTFCIEEGDIHTVESGRLGLLAGRITRRVECILDPSLVEREKQEIDAKIAETKDRMDGVSEQLKELDPEGESSTLARSAATAVAAGWSARLPHLEEEERRLAGEIQILEDRLTPELIESMRAAEAFEKAGGHSYLEHLTDEVERLSAQLEAQQAESERLDDHLRSLRDLRTELETAAEAAYPDDMRRLVEKARDFVTKGGPAFMETAESLDTELLTAETAAAERKKFELYFEKAQAWLDYQQHLEEGASVNEQLARVQQIIEDARAKREATQREIHRLGELLPVQRAKVEAIDRAALTLLQQTKKALSAGEAPTEIDVSEAEIDAHPIAEAAWRLREAVADDRLDEAVDALIDSVRSLDIDADLSRIREFSRKSKEAEQKFLNEVHAAADIEYGLSDIERQRLREAEGIGYAKRVDEIADEYWRHYSKEEDELRTLSNDERAVSEDFGSRIAMLLESGDDNLTALKKVAKENPEGTVSHFIVEASIANRDEIGGIVRRIVDMVNISEQQRHQMEDLHLDDVGGHKQLMDSIRKILYRGIFTRVSVKFANQHIRPGGKPERLSKNLSTGEKNALLMMWVLRLAQYRIEREARKRHSSVSRRRARSQSQSIMVIDGLFSNLSEPKLIRSVMSSLTGTRGNFQLIGLVHDPKYQHDFELFPVFLIGNKQDKGRWVKFERLDEQGALAFAKLKVGKKNAA